MNIEKENNRFSIIGKYLSGEASPEEAMMLHEWIEDPKNKQEYDRIVSIWKRLPEEEGMNETNVLQGWRDLQNVLPLEGQSKKRMRPVSSYLVAASIIAVLLATGVIWFSNKSGKWRGEFEPSQITRSAKEEAKAEALPDKTTVIINRNSQVVYTTTFNSSDRSITLRGEAFFDVAHDEAKPFIITVNDLKIRVVGTSFNVKQTMNPGGVQVQVQSGIVRMYTPGKQLMVGKGETGVYTASDQQLALKDGLDINSISYATKTFSFDDLSLAEASRYLESAFNVKLEFDEAKFKDCRLTAEFADKELTYILDVISATLNSTYIQKGKKFYIKGQGCL